MTYIPILTDTQQQFYLRQGDELYVAPGVVLHDEFFTVNNDILAPFTAYETDTTVFVDGTVLSAAANAIAMDAGPGAVGDHVVSVGPAGTVRGGINYSAVALEGTGNSFANAGTVIGGGGLAADGWSNGFIDNSGTLSGIRYYGLLLANSETTEIANSGTIRGTGGIVLTNATAAIVNDGTVLSTSASRAAIDAGAGGVIGFSLANGGEVRSAFEAILGSAGDDRVTNSGRIVGDVTLGGGDDVFLGRTGLLEGGLSGGSGNDTLTGGTGAETILGGVGRDRLAGRGEDDVLTGGAGPDVFAFHRRGGDDRVTDFANGSDDLDLSAFRFPGFAAVSALARDVAGGMVIDLGSAGGGTVFVEGFAKAAFDAGDVIL